ncbi:MAG: 16S rRNA (guanine(966)-N(2))-methyltransferase RsmD [Nocardioidaceae bacterium]
MTRIIAGAAGGRRLSTPPGDSTRPTADRVREAVFSTLESAMGSLAGVRFLDLFAGSGAVGLEAVSRGAAHATLVEQHRRTAAVARDNVRTLGFTDVEVVTARAEVFVQRPPAQPYDVVFLDPPYTLGNDAVGDLLGLLVAQHWLRPDAVVVVERSARDAALPWPEGIRADRSKRYGETVVWYGRASQSG